MTVDTNKEPHDQDSPEPENPEPENVERESPPEESPVEPLEAEFESDPTEEFASDGEESPWGSENTLEQEIAELKDKLLRALAENENQIRRARRDREDATKYAAANFARDMLGVADNIRRALEAVPEGLNQEDTAVKAFLDGIALTEREFLTALERHGIKKIAPLGEKFDHDHHEAMFEVPTNDAEPGTVMQVVEEGYIIHDRLLRAARVGVAKALAPPSPPGDEEDSHQVDTTA
jgi:molecular chaperone GrpE